jgi:hypothetical protein
MSIAVRLLAVALLFGALGRHSYDYYVLLRVATCGAAAYAAYLAAEQGKRPWAWVLGVITALFNPLFPVHLSRDTWQPIDILTALVFLVSIRFVREQPKVVLPPPPPS